MNAMIPGRAQGVVARIKAIPRTCCHAGGALLLLAAVALIGLYNLSLFQGIAQFFTMTVMLFIFIIVWNTRDQLGNNYLLFLGISFFFVALTSAFQFLLFGGVLVIGSVAGEAAAQLSVASRLLLAGALLASPFFTRKRLRAYPLFIAETAAFISLIIVVFSLHIFPTVVMAGAPTSAAKGIGLVISLVLVASFLLLARERAAFDRKLFLSLSAFTGAEFVSVILLFSSTHIYDILHFFGSLLDIVAFYILYRAVVVIGFKDPYRLLLQDIKDKEVELRTALEQSKARESALQESEQKFRTVAESLRSGIMTINDEGHIVYWNAEAEKMFGYTKEEATGTPFFFGPEGGVPAAGSAPVEIYGIRKDGTRFPIEISSSTWKVGGERFYTSVMRDISAYKEAERKRAEYAKKIEEGKALDDALLLSITDGILVTDTSGKITYLNEAVEQLSGLREKELLGRELDDAIPLFDDMGRKTAKEDRPSYKALTSKSGPGRPTFSSSDFHLVSRKDLRKIPLSVRAAPFIVGGKTLGAAVVWRDITEEKKIDQAKNEFISFASHQLRTPLTSASLSIDTLLHHLGETLSREQRKYLTIAFDGIKDMTDTIETLLNISRIQLGTLVINPELTDVEKTLDRLVRESAVLAHERGIKVKKAYGDVPPVKIDRRLMWIVLENLLSNAIKYSPKSGIILVETTKKKGETVIAISDQGQGIPQDQQAKVFDRLFRVETDSKVKGTGLGLYIVKAAVGQYGGRVWCESPSRRAFDAAPKKSKKTSEQKGTTFFVTIPAKGMEASNKENR